MTRLPSLHTLVSGLIRRTWLVVTLTVIACTALAGRAAAALAGASTMLAPLPHGAPLAKAPVAAPPPPVHPHAAASGLVERNMFCSDCRGGGDPGSPDGSDAFAGRSDLRAVLIATATGADAFATIHVLTSDVQGSWRTGERVPGLGVVDRISPIAVAIRDDAGVLHRLSLLDPAVAGQGAGAATPGAGSAAAADADAPPWANRIRQTGDHSYDVDRDLVRDLVGGVVKPGAVRVVPSIVDGKVAGMKLYGITPRSLPAALGLKSGDRLETLNGVPMTTADQVLSVVASLDSLTDVKVGGTRAGAPLAIDLHLR